MDNFVSGLDMARWEGLAPKIAPGAAVNNVIALRWWLTGYQQVFLYPLLIEEWFGRIDCAI
jgi:hypothetical protein